MRRPLQSPVRIALLALTGLVIAGCGATRSTDTTRAATEQLLISDAIDRAVQSLNLQTLAGQSVFLDDSRLGEVVDRNYLISTIRQQLLASGCHLREQKDQADFIVEARAGAVGTDRNDLLFGLPTMNLPSIPLVQPVPAMIPEIPIAKRRDQRGIVKVAVFAYHRETGTPVWQSGLAHQESSANDVWILGAGPFQRGTIYDAPAFNGKPLPNAHGKSDSVASRLPAVEVNRESMFTPPARLAKRATPPTPTGVVQAAQQEPVKTPATPASPPSPTPLPSPTPVAAAPQSDNPAATQSTNSGDSSPSTNSETGAVSQKTPKSAKPTEAALVHQSEQSPLPQPRFNSPN
jgi:hypothetical protein